MSGAVLAGHFGVESPFLPGPCSTWHGLSTDVGVAVAGDSGICDSSLESAAQIEEDAEAGPHSNKDQGVAWGSMPHGLPSHDLNVVSPSATRRGLPFWREASEH